MRQTFKKMLLQREVGVIIIIVAIALLFEMLSGTFMTLANLRNLFGVAPEIGIVAIGVALLMVTGEFDISVGAVFAFAPMSAVVMMQAGVPVTLSLILCLILCLGLGLANAFITLRLNIPSFIATLGTMFIIRSLVVLLADGMPPLFPDKMPDQVFTGWVGPIRASLFWYAGIIVTVGYLLSRTNFGNWVYATGGDTSAARDLGVATNAVKASCFALCAVLAGFAGIIQSQRVGTAMTSAGVGVELDAIAAAVIGGVALRGGAGTLLGAALGAFLIRMIDNGLVMARIDANYFRGAVGVLTIGAVVFNEFIYRAGRRIKVTDKK